MFTLRQDDVTEVAIVPAWGNNCVRFQARTTGARSYHLRGPGAAANELRHSDPVSVSEPSARWSLYVSGPAIRDSIRHGTASSAINPGRCWGQELRTRRAPRFPRAVRPCSDPEQILRQFPFPFRLDVTYRLHNHTLSMETVAHNTGDRDMPMGFGIHPYFRRPLRGMLHVPARQYWELVDSLPTGRRLDVTDMYDLRQPRDVSSLTLDDIFTDLIADADGMVRCTLEDHQHGVQTIVAFDAAQFPHVVVFTTPPPRQAICIEPYTCPTDAFNLQQHGVESNLIRLQPGATRRFQISIGIRSM